MQSNIADIHRPAFEIADLHPLFVRKMPFWKRSFDILFASMGLLFLSPLFLLISILIKIVSPGPVFFKQERVGYGGKKFILYKFRTMKHNTDTSIHQNYLSGLINAEDCFKGTNACTVMKKIENDSRIIPFGNFLRCTSIDELPQLINILAGEMSIIGPRPPITYEVDQYQNWFRDRFDIVPGLTGLWQVSGKNNLTYHEMIRLDIQYIRTQSFRLDLKILLLTPFVIIDTVKENYKS
jgi:lipopolysaccharide/colanic/teichoic acid biosynthesis glycosyltransferase